MDWKKLKAWAGNVWGKTTTLILAACAFLSGVLAIPEVHSLLVGFPWFSYLTAGIGLLGFVARAWVPPPPSVAITEGTNATMVDANTVLIQTPAPLPAATVQAAVEAPNVPAP